MEGTGASAAGIFYTRDFSFLLVVRVLALQERKMTSVLLVSHSQEADDDKDPVQVVRYD